MLCFALLRFSELLEQPILAGVISGVSKESSGVHGEINRNEIKTSRPGSSAIKLADGRGLFLLVGRRVASSGALSITSKVKRS
jgi:hypothetical protein